MSVFHLIGKLSTVIFQSKHTKYGPGRSRAASSLRWAELRVHFCYRPRRCGFAPAVCGQRSAGGRAGPRVHQLRSRPVGSGRERLVY